MHLWKRIPVFKDAGQVMRSEMEEMADLKRIPEKYHKYYINNKDLINQITVGNREIILLMIYGI